MCMQHSMRLALSYVTYVFIGWFKFLLLNCPDSVRGQQWGGRKNGWSAGPCPNITEWASKDVITWAPDAVVLFCFVVTHPHVPVYNPKHSMHHPSKTSKSLITGPTHGPPVVRLSARQVITPNVNDVWTRNVDTGRKNEMTRSVALGLIFLE